MVGVVEWILEWLLNGNRAVQKAAVHATQQHLSGEQVGYLKELDEDLNPWNVKKV